MTSAMPYLGPCRDHHLGQRERSKYEQFGLPETWIASKLNSGKWIGPDEYFWTPDGFFEALDIMTPALLHEIRSKTGGCFYDLSLIDQCALLGVRYQKMHPADMAAACRAPPLTPSDPVEKFSFDYFRNLGWEGEAGEGATVHLLLFVLRRRLEAEGIHFHKMYYGRLDKTLYPHHVYQRQHVDAREAALIERTVVSLLEMPALIAAYELWRVHYHSFGLARKVTPAVFPIEQFLAVCAGLSLEILTRMVNLHVMGYLGMGWPDLTLQKERTLSFVEVKQAQDKFTHRQAYWIRNYAIPLGLDFAVLHVAPSIKVGLRPRLNKGG